MRRASVVIGACVLVLSARARAETLAELEAKGEAAAKDGHYSDAITAFKAADVIEVRASHACLIALAYTRRELWPQAEIFLDLCHKRASAADPLPEWVALADQQLVERLESAQVAPIWIEVEPEGTRAQLTVSAFAPDEAFGPRTIHLGFGTHVITVTAPGYETQQRSVHVIDRMRQKVTFRLVRTGNPVPAPPPPRRMRALPWLVLGTGGAIVIGGFVYQLTVFEPIRDHLLHATPPAHDPNPDEYNQYSHRFDVRREWMYAIYGVGAATIITGCVLRYLDYREERRVQLMASPIPGGAMLGLAWRR